MFEQFPKQRPALPAAIAAIYDQQYKRNREGATSASSLAQRAESWMHRRIAADVVSAASRARPVACSTLEIGAGTLNQLSHEPPAGDYDIVEPMHHLYRDSPHLDRVRSFYDDVADVPESNRYDRITSIAAFEHICDLPDLVARSALLLAPGGALRVAIPSEGTPLWTLGWKLTTGLEFRLRHGLDYGALMRHEHVNDASEVEEVLRHFFGDVRTRVFGLARRLSLYQYHECTGPDTARCRGWLERGPSTHPV